MTRTLTNINVYDPIWKPWHVRLGPLGPVPTGPAPSHMLIGEEILSNNPMVALEERTDGRFVEILGHRFRVIGYDSASRLFGLRREA